MSHKWVLPTLYPKQRAVFYCPERISICEASTKSGKSVGGLVWLLDRALTTKGSHLWVSPVYSQSKVMYDRMERMLRGANPKCDLWSLSATELRINIVDGGRMLFKGSDNYDSIYGSDYNSAVIDEASRVREESYHAVRSTLTATGGPLRIIGNVKGKKNWAYRLARRAEAGERGMAYHRITAADAVDASVIAPGEIDDARRDLPANVFRELYEAEASDDGGNPFGYSHIEACVSPASSAPTVIYGVDLAKSVDWTVCVGLDAAGRWTSIDRWQGPWRETLDRLVSTIGTTKAIVDSTGVGDPIVEGLQRTCPRVDGFKFSSQSKQRIMEGLAMALQTRKVTIPDGPCRLELEAFEYRYTRTGVTYTSPDGSHDDCVCALALAVSGILNPSEPEVRVVLAGGFDSDEGDKW